MWVKSTNTPPIATAMNATKTTLNDVKAGFVHFNIGTPNPNNKKMIIMPIAVATPDNISPSSMLSLTLSMGIVYVPTCRIAACASLIALVCEVGANELLDETRNVFSVVALLL